MLDYYTNLPKNYREIYGIVEFKRLPRFKTYTNAYGFAYRDHAFIEIEVLITIVKQSTHSSI